MQAGPVALALGLNAIHFLIVRDGEYTPHSTASRSIGPVHGTESGQTSVRSFVVRES